MAERRFATGIFAIVLGVITLVGTGWAYDETGDSCPQGQTRNGLVCSGGGGGSAEEGGGGAEEGGGGETAPGEGSQVGSTPAPAESTTQPTGGGAESGAPGGEG